MAIQTVIKEQLFKESIYFIAFVFFNLLMYTIGFHICLFSEVNDFNHSAIYIRSSFVIVLIGTDWSKTTKFQVLFAAIYKPPIQIYIQYWSVDSKYRIYLTRLRNGVKDELLASLSPRFAPSQINSIFTDNRPILYFILQSVHLLYKYTIRINVCFIRSLRINFWSLQ